MRDSLSLAQIATLFGTLSLTAFGGASALVPELQRQIVDTHGWLDLRTFTELFAVAQAAPGPNIIFVSLLGWRMGGLPGLAVASAAILAPPSVIAFTAGRVMRGPHLRGLVSLLQTGLAPVGAGLLMASGIRLSLAFSSDALALVLCAAGVAWVVFTRRNPIWLLAAGAVIGLVKH